MPGLRNRNQPTTPALPRDHPDATGGSIGLQQRRRRNAELGIYPATTGGGPPGPAFDQTTRTFRGSEFFTGIRLPSRATLTGNALAANARVTTGGTGGQRRRARNQPAQKPGGRATQGALGTVARTPLGSSYR